MKQADMLRMANQIAVNLKVHGAGAPEAVAAHIRDFWDPRMRVLLLAHAADGGPGLDPLVLEAMAHLRSEPVD